MNVLISGGGVAGLTLAYWLEQNGHTPVIVEKAAGIRTQGYMIDFTGTGYDVAERMGIIPTLRGRAYPSDGIAYKNASNEKVVRVSVPTLLKAAGQDVKLLALNRQQLVLTLYEEIKDRVKIRFDTSIRTVAQDDKGVHVTFEDGSAYDADILVGCDGIHSTVRDLIFGDEAQFAHQLGYHFAIFTMEALDEVHVGPDYEIYVEPGLQVGIYPTDKDQWLVFIMYENDTLSVPPSGQRHAALRERLSGVGWLVPQILDAMEEDVPIFTDTLTQIQMPTWSDGRVMLIGDAAYCPTLLSGQGASMAMAGAYFLAKSLKSDYRAAFEAVESRLYNHLRDIQASAERFSTTFVPSNRLRVWMLYFVLRFANLPYFKGVVGKQFTIESILR